MDFSEQKTQCSCCENFIFGKPWLSINKRYNNRPTVDVCSYLCSKEVNEIVGDKYWDKVINKEDFNVSLIPVVKEPKQVQFLDESDMDDIKILLEQNEYIQDLESYQTESDEYFSDESAMDDY